MFVVSAGLGRKQSFMIRDTLYYALHAHSNKSTLRTFWLKLVAWPACPQCRF